MFLRDNNSIKWKFLSIATAVTAVLCLLGIFWLDKPIYLFLRNFDWSVWHAIEAIFEAKYWLVGSFILVAGSFVFDCVRTRVKNNITGLKFNIKKAIKCFLEKAKTNKLFLIFCSIFSAAIVTGVLKMSFGRMRPVFFEAIDQTGFYPGNIDWAFNSMPSGHTSATFAALVMIGMLFPKYKAATWSIAIIIGVSRICMGAHWPSDVLLGAFIGMVSADLIKSLFLRQK